MAVHWPQLVSSRTPGVKFCSACKREFAAGLERLTSVFAEHIMQEHSQDAIREADRNIAQSKQVQHKAVVVGRQFVTVDLDAALTFASMALQAGCEPGRKSRSQANARKAYDTILRFITRLPAEEQRTPEIREKLIRLRSDLEALGETFP